MCGWCYGSLPSIRRLAQHEGCSLELLPSGLFAGSGARPMDDRFAIHAWSNDQRIAQMTGQAFSQRYRERVLTDRVALLDSGPAILALTAVSQVAPGEELGALEAIRTARYVHGSDTTAQAVLAQLLRDRGLAEAASRLEASSAELRDAASARMSAGKALLRSMGVSGVPTLVAYQDSALQLVPSELLFGRDDELLRHLGLATS
jgi:putative protein-disulfide isomerase